LAPLLGPAPLSPDTGAEQRGPAGKLGIDRLAPPPYLVMKVRTGRHPGHSYVAGDLTFADRSGRCDARRDPGKVRVTRTVPVRMLKLDHQTVTTTLARPEDDPVTRRMNRFADRSRIVDTRVRQ